MRRKWWIVGGLVFLELLVCAGIIVLAWRGRSAFDGVRFFYVSDTHVEETIEETFKVDGAPILDVDVSSDDVTVTGGTEGEVEVVAHLSLWGEDEEDARQQLDVKMSQEGNRITIRVERPRWIYAFTVSMGSDVDLEIRVPDGTAVELATSSGDLAVSNVTGSADLRATSGRIRVEGFDGAMRADTSSGDVVLSGLTNAGNMVVDTTSGKATLQDVEADTLVVQASSGDLTLTALKVLGDAKVKATSGDIRLQDLEAGTLTVESSSGEPALDGLDIGGDIGIEVTSGDVVLRDMSAGSLTLSGSSARVQVERGTLDGKLDVENTSSPITVVGVAASSYRLVSSSGNVSLDGCSGPVGIRTTSGTIDVKNATAVQLEIETSSGGLGFAGGLAVEGDHSIKSTSGDVRLILPKDSALSLDIATTSGDIKTSFVVEMADFDEHRLVGAVNGGGAMLEIATSSGDVTLESR